MLQNEIEAESWEGDVRILGVNAIGEEGGNATACAGKDLPWLQETADQPAWTLWDVTYRDVVILDGANRVVGVYNLTSQDLADPGNYLALKAMLRAAAESR